MNYSAQYTKSNGNKVEITYSFDTDGVMEMHTVETRKERDGQEWTTFLVGRDRWRRCQRGETLPDSNFKWARFQPVEEGNLIGEWYGVENSHVPEEVADCWVKNANKFKKDQRERKPVKTYKTVDTVESFLARRSRTPNVLH